MSKKAVYAFSGDPITEGHINIVERALKVFDYVTVAIGVNAAKKYTFPLPVREELARKALQRFGGRVTVCSFEGLLVDFAYAQGINTIIRGVRGGGDVDYEQLLNDINRSQKLHIDTFVLFADKEFSHISSSAVKELQTHHARNILEYVPMAVKSELERVISGQYLVGITGEIGAGKSYVAQKFIELAQNKGVEAINIDFDTLGHYILEEGLEPIFIELRSRIAQKFGAGILKEDKSGFIERKKLGSCLWGNEIALHWFNNLIKDGLDYLYRKKLTGHKGLVLVNGALLAEAGMVHLVNNNVIIVEASRQDRLDRLLKRGYPENEIENRMRSQFDAAKKIEIINKEIEKYGYGTILQLYNETNNDGRIEVFFNKVMKTLNIC